MTGSGSGRTLAAVAWLLAGGVWDSRAYADPQASVGLTIGGQVTNAAGTEPTAAAFHIGVRGSLLFLRDRGADMALGPYLDVATGAFRNVDAGTGLEWLVPVRDDLPIVLSSGAFWREAIDRPAGPGVESTVFFGSRSYNFHSWYGLAAGIFAQSRWMPSAPSSLDLVFGLQIDGELLALPALLLFEAIRN